MAESVPLSPGKSTPHCSTCICGRRAVVQGDDRHGKPDGLIAWWEHEKAWADYASRFGTGQSPQRIAERGGFSYAELVDHLGHEPETWSVRRG